MMVKAGQLDPSIHHNVVRNKTEMFSYSLIATAMSIDCLKHICNIDWTSYATAYEKKLVKEAIRIQQVIKNKNFMEYFRTLRRPTTNYFFASVMLIHMESMRLEAIQALYKSYYVIGFPLSLVKNKLNLPSETDAQDLITAAGYYTENKRLKRIADREVWVQTWKAWK